MSDPIPTLITLNLMVTEVDLKLLGNALETAGLRFDLQDAKWSEMTANKGPVYKIVKVGVLGEQKT